MSCKALITPIMIRDRPILDIYTDLMNPSPSEQMLYRLAGPLANRTLGAGAYSVDQHGTGGSLDWFSLKTLFIDRKSSTCYSSNIRMKRTTYINNVMFPVEV